MNKQIKFRGKRIDNKEWVYGYLYKNDNETYILEENELYTIFGSKKDLFGINEDHCHEVHSETVGQFLGRRDNLYQGDIFRYRSSGMIAGWVVDGNSIYTVEVQKDLEKHAPVIFTELLHEEDIEIVGNIYDNPELLKERQ